MIKCDKHKVRLSIFAILLLMMLTAPAFADMPMFWVFTVTKASYSLFILPIALLIEWVAIHWIFRLTWKRSAVASVVVNLVTFLFGGLLYVGVGMFLFPKIVGAPPSYKAFIANVAVSTIFDTAIELALLALVFKARLSFLKSSLFLITNAVTAALLFAVITLVPEPDTPDAPDQLLEEEVTQLERHYVAEIGFMHEILKDMPNHFHALGFDEIWTRDKRRQAGTYRFYNVYIPGRDGPSLQPINSWYSSKTIRLDAQYSRINVEINRYSQDDRVMMYSYEIRSKVDGKEFQVYADFEPPS